MSIRTMKAVRSAVAETRELRSFKRMVERYHDLMAANGGGWLIEGAILDGKPKPVTEHQAGGMSFRWAAL